MSDRSEPLLRHAPATFHGRFLVDVPPAPAQPSCWLVGFHGYAQSAQIFLPSLTQAPRSNAWLVTAVQAPHPFYTRGDRAIVANWMTREDRQTDIDNYINYLDTVYTHVLAGNSVPVTLFGFSQGCATVCRWAIDGHPEFHRLILWAGLFPPDMDFEKGHDILFTKENYMIIGDQDPFLTPERMNEFDQLAAKLNIQPTKLTFPGKHELNLELIQQFAR